MKKRMFSVFLSVMLLTSLSITYIGEAEFKFYTAKFRDVRIHGPADVKVYREEKLIVHIESDRLKDLGTFVSHGINDDGEKRIHLSADGTCVVKIIATADGVINFGITESSLLTGLNYRIINYYDIPVKKGEVLSAVLPEYPEPELQELVDENGSSVKYILKNSAGKVFAVSKELRGEKADEAHYSVEVTADGWGAAYGSGLRVEGSIALVSAYPAYGYLFDGWYADGQKLSDQKKYRFRVEKEITVTAKFVKDPTVDRSVPGPKAYLVDENNEVFAVVDSYLIEKYIEENGKQLSSSASPTDIAGHWAEHSIRFALENELAAGYPNNTFLPNKQATRAEFVVMLVRMKKLPEIPYTGGFSDVKSDDWYSSAIQTAVSNRLASGYENSQFKPNRPITRAEMLAMLLSAMEYPALSENEIETVLASYKDKDKIPSWARGVVAQAVKQELITGYDGMLFVQKPTTRAEIASILHRIAE